MLRLSFSILTILLLATPALAYDSSQAHRLLSRQAVTVWSQDKGSLPDGAVDWLVDGSEAEDNPALRSLNHFYDPTTGQALTIFGFKSGDSALDWCFRSGRQAGLWGGDYSWLAGLQASKDNDPAWSWASLGHSLHLLSDMASPAHVHNDAHPEGDGYELWVKQYLESNPNFQISRATTTINCDNPEQCFDHLARRVAKRALSRDWIEVDYLPTRARLTSGARIIVDDKLIAKYDPLTESLVLDSEVYEAYWQDLSNLALNYETDLIRRYWQEANLSFEASPKPKLKDKSRRVPKLPQPQKLKQPVQTAPVPSLPGPVVDPNEIYWPIIDESQAIPPAFLMPLAEPLSGSGVTQVIALPEPVVSPVSEPIAPIVDNPIQNPTPPAPDPPEVPTSSGSGSEPITMTLEWLKLPVSYNTKLEIAWQGSPGTDWRYSLKYRLDTGAWQSAIDTSTRHGWSFSPASYHQSMDLALTALAPDGTSLTQSAQVLFKPLWPDNLLAYWPFDDCAGAQILEPIAGNELVQRGLWTGGRFGCALRQDALDTQTMGRWLANPIDSQTLTMTFYWRDDQQGAPGHTATQVLLTDDRGRGLAGLQPSRDVTYLTSHDNEINLDFQMPQDKAWHHVAMVFDSQASKLYLDGSLVKIIAGDHSLTAPIAKIIIRGMVGWLELDDLALWRGELEPAQIRSYAEGARLWIYQLD